MPDESLPAENCELCERARMTPWHLEDERCWVADCEVCDVPMVVWMNHGAEPPESEIDYMLERLDEIATVRFGEGGYKIDRTMRQIPDHFHAHARDPFWWFRRFGGR